MPDIESTTWTIHLAARHPGRTVAALATIILGLFAFAAFSVHWVVLLLAGLLLVGSIAEFLLPVTYTLDAEGAHMRHLGSHRILPWTRVRRVYLRRNGIKLSPLPYENWIEAYRGVMLRTPDPDAAYARVRLWLEAAHVAPEIITEA